MCAEGLGYVWVDRMLGGRRLGLQVPGSGACGLGKRGRERQEGLRRERPSQHIKAHIKIVSVEGLLYRYDPAYSSLTAAQSGTSYSSP
jgi:hypothetical protein